MGSVLPRGGFLAVLAPEGSELGAEQKQVKDTQEMKTAGLEGICRHNASAGLKQSLAFSAG